MTGRRLACLVPVLAVALAGCGSSGDHRFSLHTPRVRAAPSPQAGGSAGSAARTRREPITRTEERVIRGWAATLRKGQIARAARYFALPSIVSNGFTPARITTRREARQFNRILNCGAKVIALARDAHHLVVTTFRLVDRTGPGARPCDGGGTARTAFRVRHGHITRWFRLPDPPAGGGGSAPAGGAAS